MVEQLLHYDLSRSHPGAADVAIGAFLLVIKPRSNIVRVQPMIYDFRTLRPRKLPPLPSDYQNVRIVCSYCYTERSDINLVHHLLPRRIHHDQVLPFHFVLLYERFSSN